MFSLNFLYVAIAAAKTDDFFHHSSFTNLDSAHLASISAVPSECSAEIISVTTSFSSVLSGGTIPLYCIDLTLALLQCAPAPSFHS